VNRRVENAYQAHAAWSRGDIEGAFGPVSPGVEFTTWTGEMEGRTFHGHDGLREWFAEIHVAFSSYEVEILEHEEIDDHLLLHIRARARAVTSGVEIDQNVYQLIEFDADDRARRWSWFRDRDEALAAIPRSP
jgi:ketosteroid isomerase-like protein